MTEEERNYQENLEIIRELRPIDDDFMRKIFKDNIPLAQVTLRILLDRDDLMVERVKTQDDLKKLAGARSVELDVHAWDSDHRQYNVEIQKASSGASPHRARYHLSALDTENLRSGQEFEELPETYVIFITEKDVFHRGKAVYPIERVNLAADGELFNDGEHILYVNGEYGKGESQMTEIAKLIHDLNCADPNEMYIPEFREASRRYKETPEGVGEMCEALERVRERDRQRGEARGEARANERAAIEMLKKGYPLSDIMEISKLPEERIRALADAAGVILAQ